MIVCCVLFFLLEVAGYYVLGPVYRFLLPGLPSLEVSSNTVLMVQLGMALYGGGWVTYRRRALRFARRNMLLGTIKH